MSFFKKKWIDEMSEVLRRTTDLGDKEINKFLEKEFDNNFKDTTAILFNSYDRVATPTTLSDTLDWIQERKPIVTEAGTFFKRVDEGRALHAQIVFGNLMNRNVFKKEMFKAMDRDDRVMAKFYEAQQLLEKLRANAPYGVDGNPYSFSFSYNVSSTTTFSARGQTSMAALNFENIMNDYVKFDTMEEMFVYINNILREKDSWKFKTFDVINIIPSVDDCVDRICNKFEIGVEYDREIITCLFENMTDKERTRIFYKSNIRPFLLNDSIANLIDTISLRDDVAFVNPYEPEDEIKPELKLIGEIITEFVSYKYQPFRYEDKTRHKKRATVIIMDTDSTNLYVGNLVRFIKNKVVTKRFFGKAKQVADYNNKLMNIIAHFLTDSIDETIDFYLSKINVDNSDKRVKMKNEFGFGTVIVTYAKKSYISSVMRREGVVFTKPKLEMKGVSFYKSSSTPKTTEFIINDILHDKLLFSKNNKIDIMNIIKSIEEYKRNMRTEIQSGDLTYHKRAIKVKATDGYSDPMGVSQYKAVYVWNKLNPEDQIDLPATVTLLKIKLYSKKDLGLLEEYPEIYNRLVNLFDTDKNFGDYMDKGKLVKGKGITTIAMPNTLDEIPDWILPILDVETIVSSNMALFEQLYKPLGLASVTPKHNSSKKNMTYYTNIIRVG
jgi:hypothetical protein